MKNIRNGFTLVEVLITLGIIGVVAAMTIPNLIATHKAKRLRSQFLKSYSTIQQVFKRMEGDDISLDPATYKANGTYYKVFQQYLNGTTDCGYASIKKPKPCRAYQYKGDDDYKNFTKTMPALTAWLDDGSILLQDGSILFFENNNSDFILVSVDLNGFNNPPNIVGYDLFSFQFIDGEIKPMGDKGTRYENEADEFCSETNKSQEINGITCALKAKNDPEYFNKLVKKH